MFALLRKALELRVPISLRIRLVRWIAGSAVREFPWALGALCVIAIAALIALGALESALGVAAVTLLVVATALLAMLARQSLGAGERLREALERIGPPDELDGSRFPLSHVVFPPLMFFARDVRRTNGVEFARYGKKALGLDVYAPRDDQAPHPGGDGPRPAIIQVHGGGWLVGSRHEQGIPLLNHLASCGWVGFNIDYRLSPRATFPEHLIDVKRAIAWVREHAADYGADPDFICITGGSAGGHLSALAALTPDDRSYQPGFEEADTSVAAAVPFYGIYDLTDAEGTYYRELREWVFERYVFKATRCRCSPSAFGRRRLPTASIPARRRSWSCTAITTRSCRWPTRGASCASSAPARTTRCCTPSSRAPSTPSTSSQASEPRAWSRRSSASSAPFAPVRPTRLRWSRWRVPPER